MRTQKEIESAVARLLQNKENTPETNMFNDNVHESIDYSVMLLKNDITEDELWNMVEEESIDEDMVMSVTSILDWLQDTSLDIEDFCYPEN